MSKTRESFTTPVGRLVQGDVFEAQTKDQQGNLRVIKTGPNAGQPNPVFFIAVAFPKQNPHNPAETNHEFNAFYALLDRVARTEWPALFPNSNGPCVNPKFAMKVVDGDGLDTNGKSNADKEGFAGHWVVRFASSYAPKVVRPAGNGVWETIADKTAVKRGYYVRVAGSVTGNDNAQNPGLYVNLDMVELAGYGPEIVSGPDAATAFGGAPAALPPGATAAPSLPAGLPAPGATVPPTTPPVPGVGANPAAASSAPGVPAVPAANPPAVPGYSGYMAPDGQAATPPLGSPAPAAVSPPPPGAGVPSAPAATISPSRQMTAAAAGQTYEAFIAAGWTDEQLIANGYMIVA